MTTETQEEYEGLIDVGNPEDAIEPQLIDAGDYRVEIIKAEPMKSKAGAPMIKVLFRVHDTGLENPNLVSDFMLLPQVGVDDEETLNSRRLKLKRFCRCFGYVVENGKMDVAKLDGLIGEVKLGIEEAKDGYEASNRVKTWYEKK